jgi:hypothetical protein
MLSNEEIKSLQENTPPFYCSFEFFDEDGYRYTDRLGNDGAYVIKDVTWKPDRGECITNGNLYHRSIEEILQYLSGNTHPVLYHGKDIHPATDEDVLIRWYPGIEKHLRLFGVLAE